MPADYRSLYENFDENPEPVVCNVQGEIPSWLNGTLLRNAPAMFTIGDSTYEHLFDGLALMQRYYIEDGKLYYSTRYLRSDSYKANMAAQRIVTSSFGTSTFPDPCKNIFQRFFSYFESGPLTPTDNNVVNFLQLGDELYATTETPLMNRINIATLETEEQVNFVDHIPVAVHTVTAHQHYDKERNVYNIGSRFGKNGQYVMTKTTNPLNTENKNGHFEKTELIAEIPFSHNLYPSYYHSFGMSEKYFIFLETPLMINTLKLVSPLIQKMFQITFNGCLEWHPKSGVNIHVVDKSTGKKFERSYKSAAFFTFHHANAYEYEGCIIVDFCLVADGNVVQRLTIEDMRRGFLTEETEQMRPYLTRLILPLEVPEDAKPGDNLLEKHAFAGKCTAVLEADGSIRISHERLADIAVEFPRINYEMVNAEKYKYVYASTLQFRHTDNAGIIKVDVDNKTFIQWNKDHEEETCSEPVFVPTPGGTEEDDGVLLCPVLNVRSEEHPFLVILDAKTLKQIARCEIMTENKSDCSSLFENCEEIPVPVHCSVTGTIPEWLTGTLLRNGPGLFSVGKTTYNHLFDGLALLQRYHIEAGNVLYSCRFLQSKAYQKNMSAQRIVVSEFGTMSFPDPCKNIFSRYLSYFFPYSMTDNDAVNFVTVRDQVFAATELPTWHRVDPKSLATLEKANMKKYVAINTLTAHPHYDKHGNVYNLGSGIGSYKIFRSDVSKSANLHGLQSTELVASIPMHRLAQPSYYHSFGMSENFAIYPEMPLTLSVAKLASSRFRNKAFSDAMEWHPEQLTRFHVVRLVDGHQSDVKYIA
uniref:Uncharacterized protein n=1 Tax=Plectus sambesii TaxID=2011161 RepID=A0A914WRG6_9BILA